MKRFSIRELSLPITFHLVVGIFMVCPQPSMAEGRLPEPELRLLLKVGEDNFPAIGTVAVIGHFALGPRGEWLAAFSGDIDESIGGLVRDGSLIAQTQTNLTPGPEGNELAGFTSFEFNAQGRMALRLRFNFTAVTSAVFAHFDPSQSFDEGAVAVLSTGDNAPGFPSGSPVLEVRNVRINDSGDVLVNADVDDDAIPSLFNSALYLLTPDPAGGLAASTVIAREGEVLPGQSQPLTEIRSLRKNTAFNELGHALFIATIATPQPPESDAIYLWNGSLVKIAQEGEEAVIPGRAWQDLSTSAVFLSNEGHVAYSGQLDGDQDSNMVLVRDGKKVAQSGDVLPDLAPFKLEIVSGPMGITDSGEVLWIGTWDDPEPGPQRGLFLNDRLWIEEGVTQTIGGRTVSRLWFGERSAELSADGRFALLRAQADFTDGLYRINLGLFSDGFESGTTEAWGLSFP